MIVYGFTKSPDYSLGWNDVTGIGERQMTVFASRLALCNEVCVEGGSGGPCEMNYEAMERGVCEFCEDV